MIFSYSKYHLSTKNVNFQGTKITPLSFLMRQFVASSGSLRAKGENCELPNLA